jgi:site-specific DNA-methyltransferase (adenine-specific)
MPRRSRVTPGTSTSAFGSPGRASHDASAFYNSQLYAGLARGVQTAGLESPFPLEKLNRITCASAENLAEIPDNSVHLMVTSPPYNVGKEYDQDLTLQAYLEFLKRVWQEVYRVLAPGGRACINVANLGRKPYIPLNAYLSLMMQEVGFLMRGEIIWNKAASASPSTAWGSWRSAANPTLRDVHEYILIFSKGTFQREKTGSQASTISKDDFLELSKSIWSFPAESARKIGHPAPFPIELPRRLIEFYTYAGDVVLDPFMGSGQTALAALQTGRNYVGYEIDPRYAAMAEQRIREFLEAKMAENPSGRWTTNLPADIPSAVKAAIEAQDAAAFQCAMDELPPEQAKEVRRQLEEAGIIGTGPAGWTDFEVLLQEFEVLIQAIATAAGGDEAQRRQVLETLEKLEQAGYHLEQAVRRMWAGERYAAGLIEGLDPNSARLVVHILGRIDPGATDSAGRVTIPEEVLAAIQAQDEQAFELAMNRLEPTERQRVAEELSRLQAQADVEAEAWLASLPEKVHQAVVDQDAIGLQAALQELPLAQADEILRQLEATGVLAEPGEPEADLLMAEFEPLARAIAAVAMGNEAARPQVEALLSELDEQGFHLTPAVQKIWAGERDFRKLNAGEEWQDQQIIQRILELLK